MASKTERATHCMDCGIAREDCPEGFVGKRCKSKCRKIYMAQYYQDHAEHLSALNKRNQQLSAALKPKKVRTKLPEDEKLRRRQKRNDTYNFRKKVKLYVANHPEIFTRPPITHNIDREIYENNEYFGTPVFYLNFDAIKDCPLEHLSVEFWDAYNSRQEVENEIYVENKRRESFLEDARRQNCDYCKPSPEYGKQDNGIIKMWPT